ncbi:MAG TPA: hypothetical protein DEA08_16110, partial [Planctomycetes bacterium]|nr:hypothetical protein [Planctomycetota bacterium]
RLPPPDTERATLGNLLHLPADLRESIFPPSGGNGARLLVNAAQAYPAWEAAIRGAKEHVHLLFYSWLDDEVGHRLRDLLLEKLAEGVEVRVLVDDVGSFGHKKLWAPLRKAGGQARPFSPLRLFTLRPRLNFRNHRKLLVVDGRIGSLGGINVGQVYSEWEDLAVEVRGPVVDQLQEVFAADWVYATGEELAHERYFGGWREGPADPCASVDECVDTACAIVASGPDQSFNAASESLFLALTAARERIWLVSPYLLPEPAILAALRAAAYRGRDVRVVVPDRSDVYLVRHAARVYYPELVAAGVRVFEYEGMLHAKACVIDDQLVQIGSANLDVRSLNDNFELLAFFESKPLNARLVEVFEGWLGKSREVGMSELEQRSYVGRVLDAAAHLATPLM